MIAAKRAASERVANQMLFNDDVNQVARHMCVELGLDPDELVRIESVDEISTPFERAHGYTRVNHKLSFSRWELYVHDASIALAGWRAVQALIMSK